MLGVSIANFADQPAKLEGQSSAIIDDDDPGSPLNEAAETEDFADDVDIEIDSGLICDRRQMKRCVGRAAEFFWDRAC